MTKSSPDCKFPRFQSDQASVECAGQGSLIHGGPTSRLTGLKGSTANILPPDTTLSKPLSEHLVESMLRCVRAVLVAQLGPTQC